MPNTDQRKTKWTVLALVVASVMAAYYGLGVALEILISRPYEHSVFPWGLGLILAWDVGIGISWIVIGSQKVKGSSGVALSVVPFGILGIGLFFSDLFMPTLFPLPGFTWSNLYILTGWLLVIVFGITEARSSRRG
jgi:hypothetical protein